MSQVGRAGRDTDLSKHINPSSRSILIPFLFLSHPINNTLFLCSSPSSYYYWIWTYLESTYNAIIMKCLLLLKLSHSVITSFVGSEAESRIAVFLALHLLYALSKEAACQLLLLSQCLGCTPFTSERSPSPLVNTATCSILSCPSF